MARTNWAGSHVIAGRRVHEPRSVEELQALVAGSRALRVLGTGHTFNDLPDSRGDLVSLAAMPRRFALDAPGTVSIDGAARYAEICARMDGVGLAFEAMASLPHISVAGACATGSHGSGDRIPSLAVAVTGMELVSGTGELVTVGRSTPDDQLDGLVVSLGAMGIVTRLALAAVPRYDVRQDVYEDVAADTVLDRFDEVTSAATSVSLFTIWRERRFHQVWGKQRSDAPQDPTRVAELLAARPATRPQHPIPGLDPDACTTQLGIAGAWYDRLPHFRADRTPSSGHELQSEVLVDRRHGPAALAALFATSSRFASLVQVSEVRTVAADDLWLSPAYGRPSVAIHMTWLPDPVAVHEAIAVVEATLAPFDPRPHWGKLWTIPVDAVRASYPRLPDVVALRDRRDPERTFTNRYVDALLGR